MGGSRDPATGQFLTRDSLDGALPDPPSSNRYSYTQEILPV